MRLKVMVQMDASVDEYVPGELHDELDSGGQIVTVRLEGETIDRGAGEVFEVDASDLMPKTLHEGGQDLLDRAMAQDFRVRRFGR